MCICTCVYAPRSKHVFAGARGGQRRAPESLEEGFWVTVSPLQVIMSRMLCYELNSGPLQEQ